jgi:hypothetical protein
METWDEDTIPMLTLPPPGIEVQHLNDLDAHLAAHACPDPACLLAAGRLPLAPPCHHLDRVLTWGDGQRLWLICADMRCDARLVIATTYGMYEQGHDDTGTPTTPCGHAPHSLVIYREGWVRTYCLECTAWWSAWEVAAYRPEVPV